MTDALTTLAYVDLGVSLFGLGMMAFHVIIFRKWGRG